MYTKMKLETKNVLMGGMWCIEIGIRIVMAIKRFMLRKNLYINENGSFENIMSTSCIKYSLLILLISVSPVVLSQVNYCLPQHGSQYLGSIINSVVLDSISNTGTTFPQTPEGYSDYTNLQTTLLTGSTYVLTVTTGTGFPHNFAAWIDYDHDGEFNVGERIGLKMLSGLTAATWTFTVPSNALDGATRLRVRALLEPFGPWQLSHHPCIPFTEGEAEDYTVVITGGSTVDVAPTLLVHPVSSVGLGVEPITVRLANRGNSSVNNATVQYHLNGVLQATETITQVIPANASIDHTFVSTVDLSTFNCHDLTFTVLATGDQNGTNDTLFERSCGLKPIIGSDVHYLHSNQFQPIETYSSGTTNETTLNTVFGIGNWNLRYFETLDLDSVFSDSTCTIFIDGSYLDIDPLENFLALHRKRIEDWVAAGGRLFLNSSPDSQNFGDLLEMEWGFGGVQMVQGYSVSFGIPVTGHPLHNGPNQPNGTEWSGFYYANSVLYGDGLIPIAVDNNDEWFNGPELNLPLLAEKTWGNGLVLFGTIGASDQMSPGWEPMNHRANILEYIWQCNTSVGHGELENANKNFLYPNPTNGIVNILSHGEPLLDVRFFDLEGRCVRHESNDRSGLVNLNSLPDGFFMVHVHTASGVQIHRLIVQH